MSRQARTVWRRLDGIVLLDKPAGLSSNQALQRARHLLRADKGGHTGALDPLATGLLPLCFGEATKIAGHLLGARKAYETVACLGVTTDTDDADGQPLRERDVPALDAAQIEAALVSLRGAILQVPPIYSALKRGGEPLYVRARRGESLQLEPRPVQVDRFDLTAVEGQHLRLRVECGSGTYVRSLVRDLGEALGCGAHVLALRRLWVDPFRSPRMVGLDQIEAEATQPAPEWLLPLEAGLVDFQRVELDADQAAQVRRGQRPAGFDALAAGAHAAIGPDGQPVALVERIDGGLLASLRVFLPRENR
ncbi:MAG: tRNA pseudouridine(55) synthase TruB [Xanthomonadales bacterium]|nr:tRNA pseudouridine(55) synthase TruB [Xanthomonadales bacterium]